MAASAAAAFKVAHPRGPLKRGTCVMQWRKEGVSMDNEDVFFTIFRPMLLAEAWIGIYLGPGCVVYPVMSPCV